MSGWTQEDLDRRNREVLGVGEQSPTLSLDVPLAADLMPEWMIEAECTKILEEDGWRALRTDPVSDRGKGKGFGEVGMADHLYLRYDFIRAKAAWGRESDFQMHAYCDVMWVEFKSAKGKPSKAQTDWHAKERARGALTLIAGVDFPASVAGFTAWYAQSGLRRRT